MPRQLSTFCLVAIAIVLGPLADVRHTGSLIDASIWKMMIVNKFEGRKGTGLRMEVPQTFLEVLACTLSPDENTRTKAEEQLSLLALKEQRTFSFSCACLCTPVNA
jgi:hypothetical protein